MWNKCNDWDRELHTNELNGSSSRMLEYILHLLIENNLNQNHSYASWQILWIVIFGKPFRVISYWGFRDISGIWRWGVRFSLFFSSRIWYTPNQILRLLETAAHNFGVVVAQNHDYLCLWWNEIFVKIMKRIFGLHDCK